MIDVRLVIKKIDFSWGHVGGRFGFLCIVFLLSGLFLRCFASSYVSFCSFVPVNKIWLVVLNLIVELRTLKGALHTHRRYQKLSKIVVEALRASPTTLMGHQKMS